MRFGYRAYFSAAFLFGFIQTAFAQVDPAAVLNGLLRSGAIAFPNGALSPTTFALSARPSFECANVTNSVARVLCSSRAGANVDWLLNSVLWATSGANDEAQNLVFAREQQAWRGSLARKCGLADDPNFASRQSVECVIVEFRNRAQEVRSNLRGDSLKESLLTPEEHARVQEALVAKGLLQTIPDGQFGPFTRSAIKRYQASRGQPETGILSTTGLAELLGQRETVDIAANASPRVTENQQISAPQPPFPEKSTNADDSSAQRPPVEDSTKPLSSGASKSSFPQDQTPMLTPPQPPELPKTVTSERVHQPSNTTTPESNSLLWVVYFIGLLVLSIGFVRYRKISTPIERIWNFELSAEENRQLEEAELELRRSVTRFEEIPIEGSELKKNLDGSYHRGSKLGQRLNDELEELRPHINHLVREVQSIGQLPMLRLGVWTNSRVSCISHGIVVGLYVLTPLTARPFSGVQLFWLLIASVVVNFVTKLIARPIVSQKIPGIEEFQAKWSRYERIRPSDYVDETLYQENDGKDKDEEESDDSFASQAPKHERRWFEVLGVSANATAAEIKMARNKRAKEFHSDRLKAVEGLSPEFTKFADAKMAEINWAYEAGLAARA